MAKNVVYICGKHIPTRKLYRWQNYRGQQGVVCFFWESVPCQHCQTVGFAYKKVGLWGQLDPADGSVYQAPQSLRPVFAQAIRRGDAVEVQPEDVNKKPSKGVPMVSEFTMMTNRPADFAMFYLERQERLLEKEMRRRSNATPLQSV